MVGTILPIVYRERRTGTRARALLAYGIPSILAAAAVGGLVAECASKLGLVPADESGSAALLVSATALLYAVRELGLWHVPLLESHWQVPRAWSATQPVAIGLMGYGVMLGVGVATRVTLGTIHCALVAVFVLADPLEGAAAFGAYGVARAATVSITAAITASCEEMMAASVWLDGMWPLVRFGNGLVLAFAFGWFVIVRQFSM